ncbi:MAG: carboxymuconolactone decarboxylase family protein [Dehalococcoidia bacterium]|nr:carboxymuconolactone decarboxylase family protein [Dehalococcoidia bacterium]
MTERARWINLDSMARVPYRTSGDTDGEVSQLLRRLEERGSNLNVLRALANADGSFRNFMRLLNSLLERSKLDPRWRELAIMRVAWRNGADYEWGQHVAFARRAGLTDDEIEAVKDWTGSDALGPRDKAVLRFTDEVEDRRLTDEAWNTVAEFLDDAELVELTVSGGFWSMVGRFMLAVQIEREPGTPGFDDWRKAAGGS